MHNLITYFKPIFIDDYEVSTDIGNPFAEGDKRAEILVNELEKSISVSRHDIGDDDDRSSNSDDNHGDDLSICIKREVDNLSDSDDVEEDNDDKDWCNDDDDWEPEETMEKVPSIKSRSGKRRPPIIINGKRKCHYCDQCKLYSFKV